jgi:hypothetical protein
VATEGLKVVFNPLAFSPEEVNRMLAEGHEPAPVDQWWLTDKRRAERDGDG